jgi:hypothetical protein
MMQYKKPEHLEFKVKHKGKEAAQKKDIDWVNVLLTILLVIVVVLFVFGR